MSPRGATTRTPTDVMTDNGRNAMTNRLLGAATVVLLAVGLAGRAPASPEFPPPAGPAGSAPPGSAVAGIPSASAPPSPPPRSGTRSAPTPSGEAPAAQSCPVKLGAQNSGIPELPPTADADRLAPAKAVESAFVCAYPGPNMPPPAGLRLSGRAVL